MQDPSYAAWRTNYKEDDYRMMCDKHFAEAIERGFVTDSSQKAARGKGKGKDGNGKDKGKDGNGKDNGKDGNGKDKGKDGQSPGQGKGNGHRHNSRHRSPRRRDQTSHGRACDDGENASTASTASIRCCHCGGNLRISACGDSLPPAAGSASSAVRALSESRGAPGAPGLTPVKPFEELEDVIVNDVNHEYGS